MNLSRSRLGLLFGLAASLIVRPFGVSPAQAQANRWEEALARFDDADRAAPPVAGGILFLGSSTIVGWDVATAFPSLPVVNRGVWGASLYDIIGHLDQLVFPYAPRLIVLYAGDNDIDGGATSENVAVLFERFDRAVKARLPQTRILVIGLKPSPQRWPVIHRMRLTNDLIRQYCEYDDRLGYLDVDNAMLGWDEKPRPELYSDGLHLSVAGYELWNVLVRPFLMLPQVPISTRSNP